MSNNALYVYGIVKGDADVGLKGEGLTGKDVYLISNGRFSALVHDCIEKPYTDEYPEKIKELIISHNRILDKAMQDFEGAIPLSFNTIIKGGENSANANLKKWLNDDEERLEKLWNKIKGKKEYGIRIYYNKDKLLEETSANKEIKKIEEGIKGKTQGLSYLLQGKIKGKKQELFQNKVNEIKKEFYEEIKKAAEDIAINPSRISLEGKDLLLSLSILTEEKKVAQIKEILKKKEQESFSFHLAGPFAPYSFVENG